MKRVLLIILLGLLFVVSLGLAYMATYRPAQRETTDLEIEATPERLERGEYLATAVLACLDCHTEHDATRRTHPKTGPVGAGGTCFTREMGLPGTVCAANITPDSETGVGDWTDDEILRAIREGVDREGNPLFPLMPFASYRNLPDEDAYAVVAYLRTLEPVRKERPETQIDFPVGFFVARSIEPLEEPVPPLTAADPVSRGKHLATVAACGDCHGEDLSGGREFPGPGGLVVRTSNITPHPTGVLPEDAEDFVRMFAAYRDGAVPEDAELNDFTVMPWSDYAGMTDEDLAAIHAYLRSVPPVERQIQTYSQATD